MSPVTLTSPRSAVTGVFLIAAFTYLSSLSNGFALDDVPIILNNDIIHSFSWWRIWAGPYWPAGETLGLYRPLTSFLFAVQWAVGDGAPLVFHSTSVVLHAVASCMVFHLLSVLLPRHHARVPAAFVGGALFAVHPVHVEAVANIVGQSELLAAIAVLAACIVHATRGPDLYISRGRLVVLVLLYAIGLAAKEHAIVLPALLLVVDSAQGRLHRARSGAESLGSFAWTFSILAAVAVLFLAGRSVVLGSVLGVNPNPGYSYLQGDLRLWNALRAWPEYFRLLLLPSDLSVDYSPDVVPIARGMSTSVAVGALLLLASLVSATRIRTSPFGIAAAWLCITILPASNLLFPVGVLVAERTLYLPSVAVCIAAAAVVFHALLYATRHERNGRSVASWLRGRVSIIASFALVVAFAVQSFLRAPVWSSTASVQQSLIDDHPESFRAQWTLGSRAFEAGDRPRAEFHYELAYRTYADDPLFLLEYANLFLRSGELEASLPLLQRVRRIDPEQVPARVTSAFVFNRTGHPDSALVLYRNLQREGVVGGDVLLEIARALEGVGDYSAASAAWGAGARTAGDNGWAYQARRARAASIAGDPEVAAAALREAWQIAPSDSATRAVLSKIEDLVGSGCYASDDCAGDPLAPSGG